MPRFSFSKDFLLILREQSDQRYRNFENRYEYLQNEFLQLRQDFNEKEKLLEDAQLRHHELLLEKQKLEERRLTETEQQNELTVKSVEMISINKKNFNCRRCPYSDIDF